MIRSAVITLCLIGATCYAISARWAALLVGESAGASAAFSPTDVSGLAGWWDASDASTLWEDTAGATSATNGGNVTRWDDKSGNERDKVYLGLSIFPYLRTAEQNGLSVIDMRDSVVLYLTNGLDITRNVSGASIFVVSRWAGVIGAESVYTISVLGSANYRQQIRVTSGTAGSFVRNDDGGGGTSVSGYTPNTNDYYSHGLIVDYSNRDLFHYIDGSLVASNLNILASANNTSDTDSLFVGVGAISTGASSAWDGWIAEIIVYNVAVSESDRASIEAYLQSKWGF